MASRAHHARSALSPRRHRGARPRKIAKPPPQAAPPRPRPPREDFEAVFLNSDVPADVHRRRRRPVQRRPRRQHLALVPDRRILQILRQGRRHRHRRPTCIARCWRSRRSDERRRRTGRTAPAATGRQRGRGRAADQASHGRDGCAARHRRGGDRAGARRQARRSGQARSDEDRTVAACMSPTPRASRRARVYLDRVTPDDGGGAAQASRPVPRGAADESDRAGHRACGVGKHHARRLRGARPQGDAAGLWRVRPGHAAGRRRHAAVDA